jgi:hypothetical protein
VDVDVQPLVSDFNFWHFARCFSRKEIARAKIPTERTKTSLTSFWRPPSAQASNKFEQAIQNATEAPNEFAGKQRGTLE